MNPFITPSEKEDEISVWPESVVKQHIKDMSTDEIVDMVVDLSTRLKAMEVDRDIYYGYVTEMCSLCDLEICSQHQPPCLSKMNKLIDEVKVNDKGS
tara:strand:+ start:56 stop:346 length:291 start_codon:yes stop_codon:yes gene_type:complete